MRRPQVKSKWGSPSRGPMAVKKGTIGRLRYTIVCLCFLVVVSGLIFSPQMRSSKYSREGWKDVTLAVINKIKGRQGSTDSANGEEGSNILMERDAFFRKPRLKDAPPPPVPAPPAVKQILAITPTYPRAFQEMYLTRLASIIRTVAPPFLWIVIESPHKSEETASILKRTAEVCLPLGRPNCRTLDYVHIETGEVEKAKMNKAVVHRNRGLEYIEQERLEGIIYFMDDDNSYAPQLFEELRKINWIGAMPVGFLYTQEYSRKNPHLHNTPIVERPLVRWSADRKREVYGWETFEWFIPKPGQRSRIFNVDMAGFGFSSAALFAPPNEHGYPKRPVRFEPTHMGFLEDNFLLKLIHNISELEPLAHGCTDVWVWHVHMEQESKHRYPKGWYVEQPKNLVRIMNDDHSTWPFVVNKSKHGIEGRGEKGSMFVYE